ncbi:MAG TPA: hypothetical protein VFY13_08095 [Luteolibacter sp.]|nr:hypothetical protein [Luteolibacter sp.]
MKHIWVVPIAMGLLFLVQALALIRSGKIGANYWQARKEKMPVLYYGMLFSCLLGAVGFLVMGCWMAIGITN